jgi:hypothetical protein
LNVTSTSWQVGEHITWQIWRHRAWQYFIVRGDFIVRGNTSLCVAISYLTSLSCINEEGKST